MSIFLKDYIQKKILSEVGLSEYQATPGDDKLTYVNDKWKILRAKIHEYNVWYNGDSDELNNYYTRQNQVNYNYEPIYSRNKKNYFWAIASTESDIKRTHSGLARNIIDTIVSIVGYPTIKATPGILEDNVVDDALRAILEENDFKNTFLQEQLPLTLVEGWGAYKINWDIDVSDYPIISYYRAENVDFIVKSKRIVGIIYKDFYTDGKNRYLLVETRVKKNGDLHLIKELFRITGEDEVLTPCEFNEVEQLADVEAHIVIENYRGLLGVPCILYQNTEEEVYGRSVYTGKLDLFDDYDQCCSQRSNTVRKSTPIEYFNADFLERDINSGMAVQPRAYDRKYIMYVGGKTADGTVTQTEPVTVTQPQLNFEQYDGEANAILCEAINGFLSPATMGVDMSRKDNADAQREKEKITIFTSTFLKDGETSILKKLLSEVLVGNQLMHQGTVTVQNYDISVKFPEFANTSFEAKLDALGGALAEGCMSPKMYMNKLYGDSLSEDEFNQELKYITKKQEEQDDAGGNGMPMPPQMPGGEDSPLEQMLGADESDA